MSEVKVHKPDLGDMICDKAEEIALERYGREFNELPATEQMHVWMEAENSVADKLASEADAIYERLRDTCETKWDELELLRRLGK